MPFSKTTDCLHEAVRVALAQRDVAAHELADEILVVSPPVRELVERDRFGEGAVTLYNNTNLDVPTFIRQNVLID